MSLNDDRMTRKIRGKLWDEYQIYVAAMESLGKKPKTFDEWLGG